MFPENKIGYIALESFFFFTLVLNECNR